MFIIQFKSFLSVVYITYSKRTWKPNPESHLAHGWLKCKLDFQAHRVSAVKEKAILGKGWDPVRWKGDLWEDSDKAKDLKPLNSLNFANGEASHSQREQPPHPQWKYFSTLSESINPAYPEETVKVFSEILAMQDNTDSP